MKTTRKLLLLLLLLPQLAWAGIHVEPYLGYGMTKLEQELQGASYKVAGTNEEKGSFIEFGGRLGYSMLGLSLGLDYNFTPSAYSLDRELPLPEVTEAYDYTSSNFGVFVGYELPIMFRFYGSYYLSSNLKIDSDTYTGDGQDNTGDEFKGKGYNLGVGFTGLPFVSINLEYRSISYDERKNVSGGNTINYPSGNDSEVDANTLLLSVSVPLDL
ncbi:MAG: outer membrane beta-barrel protein [Oligoflexia bacterium]|nr:outer membrane beta-barrel protein [Oligoflexia bacterium]